MNLKMKKIISYIAISLAMASVNAQATWNNIDALYQPLPTSVHVYKSTDSVDGRPNVMYYTIADVNDKNLKFTTDTTNKRRLTPNSFYQKNNKPLLVVNCSFFSFATDQNLNVVVKNGKMVSYNKQTKEGRGKDTFNLFSFIFRSAWYHQKKKN